MVVWLLNIFSVHSVLLGALVEADTDAYCTLADALCDNAINNAFTAANVFKILFSLFLYSDSVLHLVLFAVTEHL